MNWIDLHDELPPLNTPVLVTARDCRTYKKYKLRVTIATLKIVDGEWLIWDKALTTTAKAWMPLPEPYDDGFPIRCMADRKDNHL